MGGGEGEPGSRRMLDSVESDIWSSEESEEAGGGSWTTFTVRKFLLHGQVKTRLFFAVKL